MASACVQSALEPRCRIVEAKLTRDSSGIERRWSNRCSSRSAKTADAMAKNTYHCDETWKLTSGQREMPGDKRIKDDKQCLSRRMLVHHTGALFLWCITQRTANTASPLFIVRVRAAPSSNLWPAIAATPAYTEAETNKGPGPVWSRK